ncbi:unnamed protein product [Caenorhabditis nigoni]
MTSPCACNSQKTPAKTDESSDPSSSYKIKIDEEHEIGGGGRDAFCGPLFLGTFNNTKVAVRAYSDKQDTYANNEINHIRAVDGHPNIIHSPYSEVQGNRICVVLELFEANLFDFIRTKELQNTIKIKVEDVLDGVSQGLAALHHRRIALTNLKPTNILLSRGFPNPKVVVADLGFSKKKPSPTDPKYDKDLQDFAKLVQFCLTDPGKTAQGWEEYKKTTWDVTTWDVEVAQKESCHFLAEHLIARLTDPDVAKIPARFINRHPFFWSDDLKLDYIQAVSEKIKSVKFSAPEHHLLQMGSDDVMQNNFHAQLCPAILQEALKGHYIKERVSDVLRLMRNFKAHFYEAKAPVSQVFSPTDEPTVILEYFEQKFPELLTFVFKATQYLGHTKGFRRFFPGEISLHGSAKAQHCAWNQKNPKRI